jgi:hypothetical protein
MRGPTRRYFLKIVSLIGASASGLFGAAARAVAAETGLDAGARKTLSLMAHHIFPHPRIAPSVYDQVAQRVEREASASAATLSLVRNGLRDLNGRAPGGDWSALEEGDRGRVLTTLAEAPFFSYLRGVAGEVVYRDPTVWALIGYGGSSIEHGGYLTRGFDDIAWLPKE